MIDTDATISVLPEYGSVMKYSSPNVKTADLNVQLLHDKIVHLNKKVFVLLRPAGATTKVVPVAFYIENQSSLILGC